MSRLLADGLRVAVVIAMFASLSGLGVSAAQAMEVAVLLSEAEGRGQRFVEALDAALAPGVHRLLPAGVAGGDADAALLERADLVLAVGHAAAERALRESARPVLAVLVALRDVDRLNRAHPERGLGALVLDQPLERHLRLVRAVLPDARRIGVLLGPDSVTQLPSLNRAAAALQFQADVHEARQAADLVPALDHLLFASDALLPLPDGLVSGPAAARTILLTSYRHRRPVFAHSAAYVTAGALAAVFSTPEHVAVDVADLLAGATEPSGLVRRIHSPRRFDVAVNRAVARALGLVVADEPALRERIAGGTQ
ncbi:ABC transporter substrate-binding protein [Thauera phenylacetica]|uniref:ABC transporter substrate-binding protein n=1 Tax=Thauera phenylacetica TaxID=164400 RepID=UPI001FE1E55F|nr:ABC transporter substrate binding protein [Thauera phenylacetica]